MITLKEALNLIEEYMISSGQRTFCRSFCKGVCCTHGYEDFSCIDYPDNCRNIGCSSYLCTNLRNHLTQEEYILFSTAQEHLQKVLFENKLPYYHNSNHKYGSENPIIQFDEKKLKFYTLKINWHKRIKFIERKNHYDEIQEVV